MLWRVRGNIKRFHKALLPALAFLANPAFWQGAAGATGTAGGIMSMFGKKDKQDTVSLEPMKEPFQMELGQKMSDIYKKYLPSYQPGAEYGGLSKLMTPSIYEQGGLDLLQKYIGGDVKPGGVMGKAEGVLSKTLGGEYDPFESKYYESLRKNLEKERVQSMKKLDQMISKGGLGGTTYRGGKIADTQLESFDKISDIMALIQEQERTKQLEAVKTAMDFESTSEGLTQNKLSTIMDIGSLPRLLEGIGYEDFMRKQGEFGDVATGAENLFKYNIPYGSKSMGFSLPTADSSQGISSLIKGLGDIGGLFNKPSAGSSGPIVGETTGGLNKLSSLSLRAMSPSQFNAYWNQYN